MSDKTSEASSAGGLAPATFDARGLDGMDALRRLLFEDGLPGWRTPQALRCGPEVMRMLKGLPPGPPAAAFLGMPVYVDPKLQAGEWRIVDRDGNVMARSSAVAARVGTADAPGAPGAEASEVNASRAAAGDAGGRG